MTRVRWFLLPILAVPAAGSYLMMPPAPRALPAAPGLLAPVRGAIHVHTRRSDGTGTVEDVARAAARAGLAFVIVTDHGDGAREPDAPAYRQGVLCIDAVEISTSGGHVVALGLPRTAYSLGGEARDVVEDVVRLGGMAIAAHPASARPQLRWADTTIGPDGLEWLNADSEWRDESAGTLVPALLTFPFRPPETLATLLDRPEDAFRIWDALAAERPTVAVAAADAHARIPLPGVGDPYDDHISLRVPSYEQVFRTFSIGLPDVTLTGEPKSDARAVIHAIRRGHLFSSIDALAGPVAMSFSAHGARAPVVMGDDVVSSGPLILRVHTNAPDDARIALLRDGRAVRTVSGTQLEFAASEAGVYRVEVQWPGAPGRPPIPWVVSNPIYVLPGPRPGISPKPAPQQLAVRYNDGPATGWHIENSARSQGALDVVPAVGGTQLLFRYALGGTEAEGPFVALAMAAPDGLASYDRLVFTAHSSRATRIWVQLRVPGGTTGRSWHRSVFIDETPRTLIVSFDDMTPLEATTTGRPILADVRDVLFVVDTVNTRPGQNGQLWLDDVNVGR
jgi:hypothetical protein